MALGTSPLPFAAVTQVLGIGAAIMVLVWCIDFRGGLAWEATNKSLIFNIHPVVMLIGFIILGGEAIISFKALPLKKESKKIIHLVLQAVALILGIFGICAAFKYHNESSIANLYSLHSWLGIGVIVLYALQVGYLQWIYGFLVFFYPGAPIALRSDSLPWHVFFGVFVYLLAVATATLGFLEKLTFLEVSGLAKFGTEAFLVNFTAIVTLVFGAFVILSVLSKAPPQDDFSYSAI